MKKNQWLTVKDLIEILNTMPQDAKVIVNNYSLFEDGDYYATRDNIVLYPDIDGENQVMVGTNYLTLALGSEVALYDYGRRSQKKSKD